MALKKIDVPDIDDAISEAKDDEHRKEETAHAEKIAYALEYFTNKTPDILKNMSNVISQLDVRKFASILFQRSRLLLVLKFLSRYSIPTNFTHGDSVGYHVLLLYTPNMDNLKDTRLQIYRRIKIMKHGVPCFI